MRTVNCKQVDHLLERIAGFNARREILSPAKADTFGTLPGELGGFSSPPLERVEPIFLTGWREICHSKAEFDSDSRMLLQGRSFGCRG